MILSPITHTCLRCERFRSAAATHEGALRQRNEDNYVNRPDLGLWAVADGAGGHQAGDVAARIATDMLEAIPPGLDAAELLVEVRDRIARAHEELWMEAMRRGPQSMLATTIVVLLASEDYFACLWAGDSRAYLMRDRQLRQLTHDHSLVQELFDTGAISAEEAERHPSANILTQAIGGEYLEPDKVTDRLLSGDRFLLCSDGLHKTLPEPVLAELLREAGDDAAEQLDQR